MAIVGAHVSVAGGFHKGIEKAEDIGAKAIQIFGSSPRQWAYSEPGRMSVDLFKSALKKSHVKAVFLHASYLINLSTTDQVHFNKSVNNLAGHLKIAKAIGANGLIFHVGSLTGTSREEALEKATKGIKDILKMVPGKTLLIMENSAGGKSKIGSSLEDLEFLLKKIKSPRLKICIDTAHAFEAGLIENYTLPFIKKFFDKVDDLIGFKHLAVLHVNDSKTAFNSHHDRHENIGKGHIGLDGFKNLAKEKRVNELPWILEVPGLENKGPDKENISILNSCFGSASKLQ